MKNNTTTLLSLLLLFFLTASCHSQDLHPYKKKFADMASWTPTLPGDINLKNFKPYRAVYNRTYTSATTGKPVNDQVIMTAQWVYWFGKKVILFEYHDSGALEFEDTNARTQFYYLDEKTLQMYMAVGPKYGTAQDYTTVRVLDDKITTTRVNTETGTTEFKEFVTQEPTFGFSQIRFLMWGAMELKVNDKIKLQPIFNAPQGSPSLEVGIVTEQVDYTLPNGKKYKPFIVENTNNPTNAVVNKFYIINEAPYVLAQGLYNADDDEIYRWWLKLESFQYLTDK